MNDNKIRIYGVLWNNTKDGIIGLAEQIKDTKKNKFQDEINAEVDEALGNLQDAVSNMASDSTVTDLQTRMGTVEEKVTTAEGKISTLEGKVETLEGDMTTAKSDISDLKNNKQDNLTPGTAIEISVAKQIGVKIDGTTIITDADGKLKVAVDTTIFAPVNSLPTENQNPNKIYLLKKTIENQEENDLYIEYVWIPSEVEGEEGKWEKFGEYHVSLDGINGQIASLEQAVSTLEGDVETLNGKVTTVEGKISTLEGKMSTVEGKVTTLEGQMTTVNTTLETYGGKISTLEGKVETLENNQETADGKIETLETKVETAEGKIENIEGKQETDEGYISTLQSDMEEAKGDITDIQTDIDNQDKVIKQHATYIEQLQRSVFPVFVSTELNRDVYETGINQNVQISGDISTNEVAIPNNRIANVKLFINNVETNKTATLSGTGHYQFVFRADDYIGVNKIEVKVEVTPVTEGAANLVGSGFNTFNVLNPIYAGFAQQLTVDDIESLEKQDVSLRTPIGAYSVEAPSAADEDDYYFYVAIPIQYGTTKVFRMYSYGFRIPMQNPVTLGDYRIYKSMSPILSGEMEFEIREY